MRVMCCILLLTLVHYESSGKGLRIDKVKFISTMFLVVVSKRRMEMDSSGFYGDTFSDGFGSFFPAKRSYTDNFFKENKFINSRT